MGKKGRDTRLKRQMAPAFWDIIRKENRFILNSKPGAHSKNTAYPLGVLLRDILNIASTLHEARIIVGSNYIRVDGISIRDLNYSIGLMDVLELIPTGQSYRFVPKDSQLLVPLLISDNEKQAKLVKIMRKNTIHPKKYQYGLHDGRTMLSDQKFSVGDSCLIRTPDISILNHIKFENACTVLVIRGENAGKVGKIEEIRQGIFSLPRRALISFMDKTIELPVEALMAVGLDKPLIKIN